MDTSKLLYLLAAVLAATPSNAGRFDFVIGPASSAGTCSPSPVSHYNFTMKATKPGLDAVLSCNKLSYAKLLATNLTDAEAKLINPPPLLDMSCVSTPKNKTIEFCEKTVDAKTKLTPQVMCILLKNTNKNASVTVEMEITWSGKKNWYYVMGEENAGHVQAKNVSKERGVAAKEAAATSAEITKEILEAPKKAWDWITGLVSGKGSDEKKKKEEEEKKKAAADEAKRKEAAKNVTKPVDTKKEKNATDAKGRK